MNDSACSCRNAYTDLPGKPLKALTPERLERKLDENLKEWVSLSGPGFDTRAVANSAAFDAGLTEHFLDPYRFARHVIANLSEEFVPRLRRGYSHGDLHGRKVLVGRVGDRVLWPAAFDYGDTSLGRMPRGLLTDAEQFFACPSNLSAGVLAKP